MSLPVRSKFTHRRSIPASFFRAGSSKELYSIASKLSSRANSEEEGIKITCNTLAIYCAEELRVWIIRSEYAFISVFKEQQQLDGLFCISSNRRLA